MVLGVDVLTSEDFQVSTPSSPIIGSVTCRGDEHRLQDCFITDWSGSTCDVQYAGVMCKCMFIQCTN